MNDHDAGYKVFVRTVAGLTTLFLAVILLRMVFITAVVGAKISELPELLQLGFRLSTLGVLYCAGAILNGRFLWMLNRPVTIRRLFVITLLIAIIFAWLSPLILGVLTDQPAA
ncbi:MAG: hypothetical protein AAF456_14640 [Planctomycetota bacterium]